MTTTPQLRPYQQELADAVRDAFRSGARCPLVVASTGAGKCLARGTPVLMFDGTIKPAEAVNDNDLVMGPDSQPRRVVGTSQGQEMLYRVTPTKGDAYTVNESHILSLKITGSSRGVIGGDGRKYKAGDVANISVTDYLASSPTFKHMAKGWRAPVDSFGGRPANDNHPIPPYILGVWLGDGDSREPSICNVDQEVVAEWTAYAEQIGHRINTLDEHRVPIYRIIGPENEPVGRGHCRNRVTNALRALDLFENKHIPHGYKTASRKDRLELLAGIIDTDGYLSRGSFDIVVKQPALAEGICFVARSLGLAAYSKPCVKKCTNTGASGKYHRISISGDIDMVPCRVPRRQAKPREQKNNVLVTGIAVEPVGWGDYFGFEIEGPDRLFLLGDFTVTHNTVLFSYITHGAAGRGNPTLIAAHRKEIIRQISLSLARFGVEHQVIAPAPAVRQIQLAHFKAFGRSYVRQNSITMVGSVQTIVTRFEQVDATLKLARTTAGSRPVKMLVVMDEGHHVVEDTQWGRVMDRYHREAGGLGLIVTASPERLDGRGLGAGFGGYADTMIEAPPMSWLIEQGFLSRYRVFTAPHQISMDGVHTRMGDFVAAEVQERVDKPSVTGDAIEHWRKHAHGMRAVVFCVSVEHSQHVAAEFQAAGIPAAHIDGSIDDTERDRAVSEFADGKVLILTQVNLVSEGFDLGSIAQKDVTIDCIIDLAPTQSLVNAMQRWGRALRPAPGKVAVILDHAGNIIRHGFPDEDREWTLEGRKKSKRGAANDNDEPEVRITTCPKCFAIHKPAPSCPACGHIYPIKARQVEQIDGTLAELDADAAREAREARKTQGQAQTVEDMMRTLGYSRGRAEKILQAREEKARLQDEVKAELLAWQAENRRPVKDAFGVFLADVKMMKPKELRELLDRVKAERYKLTA